MIVAASLRALLRRPRRTALALAGIAVSAALLLDMTMLATGLTESFGRLLGANGFTLRVTPKGILPFDSEATIRDAGRVERRIAATPGVARVAPVLGAQLFLLRADGTGEPVFTVGVDPGAQFLYRVVQGRTPRAGEVVVSEPLARAGVRVGDRLALAADLDAALGTARQRREARVSAVADFTYDYAGQRSLAVPIDDLRRWTGRADEASLFAVAPAAGVADAVVARRISAALPQVSTRSLAELMGEMNRRLLYFRQMATILGSIALVVTALLVSTIVAIGVRERFGEIATLRAVGVARGRILAGVVAEGLVLAAAGSLLGLPLGWALARRLDGILLAFPGLPAGLTFFVWNAARVLAALGAVVLIGAGAGAVPGYGAVRAPLGQALREEAE